MADLAFYHCFVCGKNITAIVTSTGLYQCPHCGTRQSGKPISQNTNNTTDTTK